MEEMFMSYARMVRDEILNFEESAISAYIGAYGEETNIGVINDLTRKFRNMKECFIGILAREECPLEINTDEVLSIFSDNVSKLSKKIHVIHVPNEWAVELLEITMFISFYISLDSEKRRLTLNLADRKSLLLQLHLEEVDRTIDLSEACSDTMTIEMTKEILSPRVYSGDNDLIKILKSII
jgi:hypothetical protein